MEPQERTSYGPLIVLVIIVAVIVAGAFYVLNQRMTMEEVQLQTLSDQGNSTEPEAIEQDLSQETPDDFDQDLDQAFMELDAAFETEAQ